MKAKVLVVGLSLRVHGGHTRFVEGLLHSGLPYEFVHFNPKRPPKERSSSRRPGYQELLDAGIIRACLGAAITLYHVFIFPFILLKERPDVVHFAGATFWQTWEFAVYILVCRLFGIRTIYHWHAPFDVFYTSSGPTGKSLIKRVLEQVDRHLVLTKVDRNCMLSLVRKERVYKLLNGLSRSFVAQFRDQATSLRQDEIRILFIGGRDPFRKGIFDILKALPTVIRNHRKVRLILTGGGNVTYAIEQTADLGVENHISYLGWVSEIQKAELYASADMLLLPSYEEALPYVILEAMAARLPIISTPIGAIPEVIEEGINGFLVNPGDCEALAERIGRLCRDDELRLQMGHTNRDKVKRLYMQDVIFQELEAIYDQLVNNQ